jgi:hypothetical protein
MCRFGEESELTFAVWGYSLVKEENLVLHCEVTVWPIN